MLRLLNSLRSPYIFLLFVAGATTGLLQPSALAVPAATQAVEPRLKLLDFYPGETEAELKANLSIQGAGSALDSSSEGAWGERQYDIRLPPDCGVKFGIKRGRLIWVTSLWLNWEGNQVLGPGSEKEDIEKALRLLRLRLPGKVVYYPATASRAIERWLYSYQAGALLIELQTRGIGYTYSLTANTKMLKTTLASDGTLYFPQMAKKP